MTLPGGRAAAPEPLSPDAFAAADVDHAAELLATVVREVRPQVVLTYEPGGGYGHPDHVMAHRVALRAVELAAETGSAGSPGGAGEPGGAEVAAAAAWRVPKVYGAVMPESLVRQTLRALAARSAEPVLDPDGPLPSMVVPDDRVDAVVSAPEQVAAKAAALAAHRTQLSVLDGERFALSNGIAQPISATEWYQLLRGVPAGPYDDHGRELDLFAGTGV